MKEKRKEILEWVYCIIVAIIIALFVRYFIGTPTIVKQPSMYPTLQENQRLILSRIGRTFKKMPERGDIITFEAPSKSYITEDEYDPNNPVAYYEDLEGNFLDKFIYNFLEIGKISYIKRVIALPGERVEIKDGAVYVKGEKLEEDYLQPGVITDSLEGQFTDFVVPEGYVFAMGDNRSQSTDCRRFGCIPLNKIEGKVKLRIWPLNVFGKVK